MVLLLFFCYFQNLIFHLKIDLNIINDKISIVEHESSTASNHKRTQFRY